MYFNIYNHFLIFAYYAIFIKKNTDRIIQLFQIYIDMFYVNSFH